jgi:formylmethanofuran dehydrogenase subunit E
MASPMLRGFLKILVLKALGDGPKSGYALMKYVEERMGAKPSPGSMYPLLDALKADGFVVEKGKGRANEYRLTPKGKAQTEVIEQKRTECLTGFIEGMKMLSALTGEDMAFPMAMVDSMRRGEIPFKEINPEWDNVRNDIFTMLRKGALKQQAPKIRKILQHAHKELASL